MPFSELEKSALLNLKGVGPTVILRLEQLGIDSFEKLARYQPNEIVDMVAQMLHSTCWKNSPQAKTAIEAAISLAQLMRKSEY